MRTFMGVVVSGALLACAGEGNTVSTQQCANQTPTASPASGLTSFEQSLVGPLLSDVRTGVQPWDEQSIGICKGQSRECQEYLGSSAEELPPGEYMMRAELKVPQVGSKGAWRVKLETECTTTRRTERGESVTTSTSSKEYEVQYAGTERGSRLSPLVTIRSPEPSGAKHCSYTLTSLHPDTPLTWTGSWSVPQS
jgi:hypothetical protein